MRHQIPQPVSFSLIENSFTLSLRWIEPVPLGGIHFHFLPPLRLPLSYTVTLLCQTFAGNLRICLPIWGIPKLHLPIYSKLYVTLNKRHQPEVWTVCITLVSLWTPHLIGVKINPEMYHPWLCLCYHLTSEIHSCSWLVFHLGERSDDILHFNKVLHTKKAHSIFLGTPVHDGPGVWGG